jgi:superfamily I DNA/RNA helicase
MENLNNKINEIFHYHKGANKNFVFFSADERKKFIDLINKRISLSAAAGSLIEMKERQLAEINRIQNNYIDFISSYPQAFIVGGAGTGKTWIGVKKANILEIEGKKVLFVCYNKKLIDFIKKTTNNSNIDFYTFDGLAYDILGESKYWTLKQRDNSLSGIFDNINFEMVKKYDAIIVDEAQDFAEEWAITLRSLLKDESNSVLYVFYDKEQNIFNKDFKNGFLIDSPPFYLKENIRNTANIYKWAVEQTGYGSLSFANTIEGASPEISRIKTKNNVKRHLNSLLNRLIKHEYVSNQSVTILSNRKKENSALCGVDELGSFIITEKDRWETVENEIAFSTLQSFKGLESDVIIYLDHSRKGAIDDEIRRRQQYIAYTRARFYLYVIEVEGD